MGKRALIILGWYNVPITYKVKTKNLDKLRINIAGISLVLSMDVNYGIVCGLWRTKGTSGTITGRKEKWNMWIHTESMNYAEFKCNKPIKQINISHCPKPEKK